MPRRNAPRQPLMISQKVKIGGVFWTMFELSLNKIRKRIFKSRPSVSARLLRQLADTASKTEKFSLHFFNRAPQKIFSIKEKKIFLFCLPANAGIAETLSHPQPAFGGQSKRAKIPSPRPPSFLPACFRASPDFLADGLQIKRVAGGLRIAY